MRPSKKIALLAVALCVTVVQAAQVKVFTPGNVAGIAERFTNSKDTYLFVEQPAGEFTKPAISKYATLNIPYSIKMERFVHEVEVGLVVSDQGKVVATCIVSSNCKALEEAARSFVSALVFRPASLDGKPVYFYMIQPVSYQYVDPAALGKR